MNNQHSKSCRNENCEQCRPALIRGSVDNARKVEPLFTRLEQLSDWLDDELFELEIRYEQFVTESSSQLRANER